MASNLSELKSAHNGGGAHSPTGRPVRVLRIIARLNVGGPAIHVALLNSSLDAGRFQSLLVCGTENTGEGSMVDFALSRGVQLFLIPEMVGEASFRPRDLKALIKLYRLIRHERPDIVHTHTAKAGFLGRVAARLARAPVVVHTYHGHVLHSYYGPAKTLLLRRMEQALARMTDRIVAISRGVKTDLVSYGVAPAEQISIIPLGFELGPFLQCERHRGVLRRELGLPDNARLVGIVGRIFPIKNHRLFLQAASRIASREPETKFLIVGDGILRPAMEQYAAELNIRDRVTFTGWRRDLAAIYADLDVLIVSSDNEGTPVSAIEAMASARPVVATRVGGLPDLITDCETGLLVPPRDPEALSEATLRLFQDPALSLRIGEAARAVVRERFALHRLRDDMERLYEELLAAKGLKLPAPCGQRPRPDWQTAGARQP